MPQKTNGAPKPKSIRGFAAMTAEQRRAICKLGGRKTARRYGKAHMSRIGKLGRAKRAKRERLQVAYEHAKNEWEKYHTPGLATIMREAEERLEKALKAA